MSSETPGLVDPGFETVASLARDLLDKSGGGALCVYVDGEAVLDLWSGHRDPDRGLEWQADSMAMSWSTTKGVVSTALHMLVERGALHHDEPIATWWPEFAAEGKAEITLRQLMAMEAGLYDVRHMVSGPEQLLDHDTMAELCAQARPLHQPGAANAYHAFTYGWLAAEIVRRVTGMTLGAFIRREIAEPLALDGCFVGLPGSEASRVAARPDLGAEPSTVRRIAKMVDPVARLAGFSPSRFAAAFLPAGGHEVIPTAEFLSAEVPGVNGVFTARSLARLYTALGSDQGLDGVRLWSEQTRRVATATQNTRRDLVIPIRVGWQLGFHPPFPKRKTSDTAFGFYGAYGSGAFADPARGLSVGFVVQEAKGLPLVRLVPKILSACDRHRRDRGNR